MLWQKLQLEVYLGVEKYSRISLYGYIEDLVYDGRRRRMSKFERSLKPRFWRQARRGEARWDAPVKNSFQYVVQMMLFYSKRGGYGLGQRR